MKKKSRKPNQIIVIFLGMGVGGCGGLQIVNASSFNPVLGTQNIVFTAFQKKSFRPLSALSGQVTGTDALSVRSHSEGHPRTEGTFARTLVNVGDLHRSGECQESSRDYGVEGSPKFAKLRQVSPKFA